ncbi:fumarylacetoacetate hydrolase family protein [Myxococcota bacterium]
MGREHVITLPPRPTLPVKGCDGPFPVHQIWCVAKNYAAHAREMGADPQRQPPRFFAKPANAVVGPGELVAYPPQTSELHHEVELVMALATGGRDIPVDEALSHVFGCAVGLDLTRRDLQRAAKEAGQPWDLGKGFDHAAPCSEIVAGPPPTSAELWLSVNGDERQRGNVADMTWDPAELIARLSSFVSLMPGDLIFTGTPAGVGPLAVGDRVEAGVEGLARLSVDIGPRLV